jgi:hypothetical protein
LSSYARKDEQKGGDFRIPIEVLHGQAPEIRLQHLLDERDPSDDEYMVVIAPVLVPPADWPERLRLIKTTTDEFSQDGDCLCCALSTEVSTALSRLFFSVLRKEQSSVSRVFVVTASKSAEPMALALKHAPFLGQRYRLQGSLDK